MLYLIYILTFGSFFLIKYFLAERKIRSNKEIVLLALFPMAGYGNWIYNHKCRESEEVFLPRKWYIWKKMVFQNFWLTILLTVYMGFLLGLDTYYTLLADGTIKISSGAVLIFDENVDPTLATGLFLRGLTISIISFILLFFLVIVPAIVAKVTKTAYTKMDE